MRSSVAVLYLLIVAFSAITLFSCRSGVEKDVYENPEAGHKVLITGATSQFKNAVIEGIVERFKGICQIEILPSDQLEGIDPADYSAIVIMDDLRMGKTFGGHPREMAEKIENKEKIILFLTAGKPDWKYSYEGIDAITSASEDGKEVEVIDQISARMNKLVR
jgi:hypothetical protein